MNISVAKFEGIWFIKVEGKIPKKARNIVREYTMQKFKNQIRPYFSEREAQAAIEELTKRLSDV